MMIVQFNCIFYDFLTKSNSISGSEIDEKIIVTQKKSESAKNSGKNSHLLATSRKNLFLGAKRATKLFYF